MKKVCLLNSKRILAAALSLTLLAAPIFPVSEPMAVHAENTTQNKIAKPVIKDVSNDYKGLTVYWKPCEGATGYHVFRRRKSSDPYELLAEVGGDVFSYTDIDAMKEGGIYTYMIQAFDGDKVSEESAPKTASRFLVSRLKMKIKYAQKSARQMQKMVNDFRTGKDTWCWNPQNTQKVYTQGIGKLAYDYSLEKIAMLRAAEIAIKFNHERPNGKTCFSAMSDANYKFTYAGENIAYGYKTAKKAFEAFQETNQYYQGQGHRRNMLSTNYNVCAFGHAKVNGVHYWVQLFAYTTDDSDYTKTISTTKKVTVDVSSEDLSSYKKTLKAIGAEVKDYAPKKVTWVDIRAEKKKAHLIYNKGIGAMGYEIYRSGSRRSGFKKVGTVTNQLKLQYTDKKLARKKKYYYYIVPYRVAHDEKIYGKKSEVKMVKTL
ncbi:CAP domain-containing protein [Butyrivibrio sp. JL13D10]|uniref:CAP domain-containing protein n=1 Tax=Butyrivibrio sp. JL13D10 TaxID=3236815 RepID=UPI0038B41DEF